MIELCLMAGAGSYVAVLLLTYGTRAPFWWFWLVLALCTGGLHVFKRLRRNRVIRLNLPLWLKVGVRTTVWLVVGLVIMIEMIVIVHMFAKEEPEKLDYLIVLGTYVEGDEPSLSLKQRLDKAIEYMERNEEIVVIVSGGKGTDSRSSEAYVMATYLMNQGVAAGRILTEDKASSTRENLIYSYQMIPEESTVGVVTNSFHVYRAMALAEKLGFDTATGIASPSDKLLLPTNMVREFFVIIKEKIMGYI